MLKEAYTIGRDLSWKVLIGHRVKELPVALSAICESESICVQSYQKAQRLIRLLSLGDVCRASDGCSVAIGDDRFILYDEKMPATRVRFTIAHELGHCLLQHLSVQTVRCSSKQKEERPAIAEQEANVFASRLLAPICVLLGLNIQKESEIASVCHISKEAARIRFKQMQIIWERNDKRIQETGTGCLLSSPLEQQVYAQFTEYISKNRINP